MFKLRNFALAVALFFAAVTSSLAVWPVHDAPSNVLRIAEAAKAMAEYIKQYETLIKQLQQAKQMYEQVTGKRGFEKLLMGEFENSNFDYLPPDARASMIGARDAVGESARLAKVVERLRGEVTSLTNDTFGGDMGTESARIWKERVNQLAGMRATSDAAQTAAVNRVKTNKQLVEAIGTTDDAKSIGELQARIQAQQNMLLNEQIRLYALAEANRASQEQLVQMQSDMLMKMDQRPAPKVVYGK